MRIEKTWHGDEMIKRSRRANGRAIIAVGERTAANSKKYAHVVSGNLRRSIHAAKTQTMGEVPATTSNVSTGATRRAEVAVEVGSWMEYACVEEVGRGHRFMQPGWEETQPTVWPTIKRAYDEEGL